MMLKRWGSDRYITARKEYRENLKNWINSSIEDTLDSSRDPEFFEFTRKSPVTKPVPTLTMNDQVYAGHARIAKCLADHHRAGPPIFLQPHVTPEIPPVHPREVTDAIKKAPSRSVSGPDAISAELLHLLHTAHPSCLSNIYTEVLRSGIHPDSWKAAIVVPIPKANKTTYTHPKSWRSIHLLSVVSKTLERIVLLRLQRDDTTPPDTPTTNSPLPMGPTQFGSRISIGTSDAMQTYLRWRENAQDHDHLVTLISADVEGGFDKINPHQLHLTDLNPLYTPWIQHWAANRSLQFRYNAKLDPTKYITNNGIPQGSPLSPFLFGAYIKKLMDPRVIATPDASRIIISYVDDVLICVSASSHSALERLAKETWATLTTDAASIGMTFAENKTRTLHDRTETWGIGTSVDTLRFLRYWIETPPTRRSPPSYNHHINHWTTKANYSFNVLRALSLRSSKGLRSTAILRILDACTRSILLYGLEFWGSDTNLILKTDAFIYAAARALFDLPIATPHRALSSDFSIVPTSVRYNLITRRIAACRLTFDPLKWLDAHLPCGSTRNRIRLSLDSMFSDTLVPWYNVSTTDVFKNVFSCLDVPGDDFVLNNFQEGDLIVCTDGSFNGDRLGYSFCIFDRKECLDSVMDYHVLLTPRKTILDAEATALVCGLDASLVLPHTSSIYLLSDCRSALRIFLQTSSSGPLSYLDTPLSK